MKLNHKSLLLGLLGLTVFIGSAGAHSDAFKPKFVDSLIPGYISLQEALAQDNLDAAKAAASELLRTTVHHGPKFSEFTVPASRLAKASDLKTARAQFLEVSMEMQDLIDHVGTSNKVSLYEAHCPMAFGGKGASWLQDSQQVNNPYYGSMMLRCGSIESQVAGKPDSGAHGDAAHNHGNH
jgi:Cu(I)/Ag(I) efflux system membrane fusion protein